MSEAMKVDVRSSEVQDACKKGYRTYDNQLRKYNSAKEYL